MMNAFLLTVRIVTALALFVNAWVHFRLAAPFEGIAGTLVSQGDLFRIQAVVNVVAAFLLVVVARWWTALFASFVAAGGLTMLLLSVYVPIDLTALGLPLIFEPAWYLDKAIAAASQGVAVLGGITLAWRLRRGPSHPVQSE